MKEMIYQPALKERDILDSGEYNGYKYYIVSLGTHPCAYVEVPEGHICYGKCDEDAYDLDIDVHGGITFGDFGLKGVSDKFYLVGITTITMIIISLCCLLGMHIKVKGGQQRKC